MAGFDAGAIYADLQLNTAPFLTGIKQARASVSSFVGDTARMALGMIGAASAIAGVTAAATAIGIGFRAGIQSIDEMRVSIAGLAADISSFHPEMPFDQATEAASALIEQNQRLDAQFTGTQQELNTLTESMIRFGVSVDRSTQAGQQQFVAFANLIKFQTAGQNFQIQAMQEIRALAQGQVTPNARIVQLLKAQGVNVKEMIPQWKAQGILVQEILKRTEGYQHALSLIEDTLQTQGSTLKTRVLAVLRAGLQPAYDDILRLVKSVNAALFDQAGQMTPLAQDIVKKIKGAWEEVRDAIKAAWQWLSTDGKALLGEVQSSVRGAKDVLTELYQWWKGTPELVQWGIVGLVLFGATGPTGRVALALAWLFNEHDKHMKRVRDEIESGRRLPSGDFPRSRGAAAEAAAQARIRREIAAEREIETARFKARQDAARAEQQRTRNVAIGLATGGGGGGGGGDGGAAAAKKAAKEHLDLVREQIAAIESLTERRELQSDAIQVELDRLTAVQAAKLAAIDALKALEAQVARTKEEHDAFADAIERVETDLLRMDAALAKERLSVGKSMEGIASEAMRPWGRATEATADAVRKVLDVVARELATTLGDELNLTADQIEAVYVVALEQGADAGRAMAQTLADTAARVAEVNATVGDAGNAFEDYAARQRRMAADAKDGTVATNVLNESLEQQAVRLRAVADAADAAQAGWSAYVDDILEWVNTLAGQNSQRARDILRQQIDYLRSLGTVAPEVIAKLEKLWADWTLGLADWKVAFKAAFVDSFTRFFEDVLSQAKTFGEALQGFFQSLVNAIISYLAQLAAVKFVEWLLKIMGITGLQSGGVTSGRIVSPTGQAVQGVVTRPMLSAVALGEGGPEAVVPLDRGRAIPVTLNNAAAMRPDTNIQVVTVIDPRDIPPPPPGYIQQVIVMDWHQRGTVFRTVKGTP